MKSFASACVLAGGKGSRLGGADKLYLEIDGKRLAGLVVESLRSRFSDIIVATGRPESFQGLGVRIVPDEPGFQGPLAGLLAASRVSLSRWLYLIAVDMPRFSAAWVDILEARIDALRPGLPEPMACVASSGVFFEPFHAFYRADLSELAKQAVGAAPHSIQALLAGSPILRVPESEVASTGVTDLFFSVNTLEDLEAARAAFPF